MIRRLEQTLCAPVHPHAFGLIRVCLGLLLAERAWRTAVELQAGRYFGEVFHLPFFSWLEAPSRAVFVWLVAAQLVCAGLLLVGKYVRHALIAAGALGLYVMLLDRLQYHHNRYALHLFCLLLAFAPIGRSFSWFEPPAAASEQHPIGGGRVAQWQLSLIYLASSVSKLLDPEWRDGVVLGTRLGFGRGQAEALGVPRALLDALQLEWVTALLARGAIVTEITLSVALFLPRTRVAALWLGCVFHLLIEATSQVDRFTWLTLAMYGLFVTHDVRARVLHYDGGSRRAQWTARLWRALDFFARYELRPWQPDRMPKRHVLVVQRRDGSRVVGFGVWVMAARTLPLLFPLWLPLMLIESLGRGRDISPDS